MAPGLRRTQEFMSAAKRYYQQAAKAQPSTLAARIYPNLQSTEEARREQKPKQPPRK